MAASVPLADALGALAARANVLMLDVKAAQGRVNLTRTADSAAFAAAIAGVSAAGAMLRWLEMRARGTVAPVRGERNG